MICAPVAACGANDGVGQAGTPPGPQMETEAMPDAIASDPTELAAAWQSVVATETPAAEQAA
ncbi:MAG: hypothetical protein WA979_06705, partial [Pacificimonas sp.]